MLRRRFHNPLDPTAKAFGSSVTEDAVLLAPDLLSSLAHVRMLRRQGLLTSKDARALIRVLGGLLGRARTGTFALDPDLEDVHMNVESEVTRVLGDVGARLPTGRSRNDLVATDILLYLRTALLDIIERVLDAQEALLHHAEGASGRIVYPAATHLQDAQCVYLGQWLQVHAHRFARDAERLREIRERIRTCPLGSGAVAGSSLPLDPRYTAKLLGFEEAASNSIDAVSDRDASLEALLAISVLGVHVSGLAEEWVLWSTSQFGRLRLDDAFVTTSSLMPHKRNPDMAELLRAEAGALTGLATAYLAVLKGLPLSYNRDLQVGKRIVIEGIERARKALTLLPTMISSAHFLPPPKSAPGRATASVEVANALVEKGVPFRIAHERVAQHLRDVEEEGGVPFGTDFGRWARDFPELSTGGWKVPSPAEEPEVRRTYGGSSLSEVRRDRNALRTALRNMRSYASVERDREARIQARLCAGPL